MPGGLREKMLTHPTLDIVMASVEVIMEAEPGVEPRYTDLQSAA